MSPARKAKRKKAPANAGETSQNKRAPANRTRPSASSPANKKTAAKPKPVRAAKKAAPATKKKKRSEPAGSQAPSGPIAPLAERKKWARLVVRRLRKEFPDVECELLHTNAFELTAATILSAQCTDEMVNKVTPHLFARFSTPAALAAAEVDEVEALIRRTGFYRNKTKNIMGMAQRVMTDFDGQIPQTMEELLTLPGVARKTANVVLGVWFKKAVGVVVDTHVKRISNLLGLTGQTDPKKIELDWMELIPRKDWIDVSHLLIWHGRRTCIARRPQCSACTLRDRCPSSHA